MAAYKKMKVQVSARTTRQKTRANSRRGVIPDLPASEAPECPVPRPRNRPPTRIGDADPTPKPILATLETRRLTDRSPHLRDLRPSRSPLVSRNSATRARRRAWTPRASRLCSSSASKKRSMMQKLSLQMMLLSFKIFLTKTILHQTQAIRSTLT